METNSLKLTAKLGDKEIDLSQVEVLMEFEDQTATADAETMVRRSLALAQENIMLHTIIAKIKTEQDTKIKIATEKDISNG